MVVTIAAPLEAEMAGSPYPWPFNWRPTYPAQLVYSAGRQIAYRRHLASSALKLFLNAQVAALDAIEARSCDCPRRRECAVGRLFDAAAAVVRWLPAWRMTAPVAPLLPAPGTLEEVLGLTRQGSRLANALASSVPPTAASFSMLWAIADAILRWTGSQALIDPARPAPDAVVR